MFCKVKTKDENTCPKNIHSLMDVLFLGPQIDAESQQKILKYIELGNKQGAKLECGGKRVGNEGFFVEPTIFSNVTDNMSIAQEEVICLVLLLFFFASLELKSISFVFFFWLSFDKIDFRSGTINFEIQNS